MMYPDPDVMNRYRPGVELHGVGWVIGGLFVHWT